MNGRSVRATLAVTLIGLAGFAVACGDDGDDAATAESQQPSGATAQEPTTGGDSGSGGGGSGSSGQDGDSKPERPGTTIATGDSQFGEALFDGDQRAIYYFDKETSPASECYDACAAAWPPVLTEGDPEAAAGAEAKLLGTTERDDGTTQVTYDGRPLYYYVDDPPGEILCHNVDEFGGLWLAVQPNGEPF